MKSLRGKVTLLVLLLGIPFVAGSFQGILWVNEQSQIREQKSSVRRAVNRLVKDLRKTNPRGTIQELYDQAALVDLGVGITLLDKDAKPIWQSPEDAPKDPFEKGVQQLALDQGSLLYILPERPKSASDVTKTAYGLAGIAILVYALGAWFLVGWTLKPIAKMVTQVATAAQDDHSELSSPTSDREIVKLVETLNHLITGIREESAERIKSYASLSHELRTPIQALLGHVELALGEDSTKEELEATLLQVQSQVLRLNALSEAVLLLEGLSQSDHGNEASDVSLRGMVDGSLVAFGPLMEVRQVTVDADVPESVLVRAVPEHLEIVIRNLVHNAVKFAPHSSAISITLDHERLNLVITNSVSSEITDGVGLGNGLGLRICQAVARRNQWKLTTGREGDRFVARLEFDSVSR